MPALFAPIVGMFYRPPAKAILAVLPGGCALLLEAEPENPFDAKAVKVMVASEAIPTLQHQALAMELPPYGFDLAQVLAQPLWHIGYVAKTHNGELSQLLLSGTVQVTCALAFDTAGKPTARAQW